MSPEEKVTCDTIINFLKQAVENKEILPPSVWVDGAEKINILLGDEDKKYWELHQEVAKKRLDFLLEDPKRNVSKAKLRIEATDEYKEMGLQKAKTDRIREQIRIAKLQARLKNTEFRGY